MMVKKIGVFYFSSIPYNFLKQRPQQLYKELKENFSDNSDFFYVEPPSLSNKLKRILQKKEYANIYDSNVLTLPFFPQFKKFGRTETFFNKLFTFFITKYFSGFKLEKKIAIICTPFWEPFISKKNFDVICYDYLDSIKVHNNEYYSVDIAQKHEKLILKSDLIFATAEKLKEEINLKYPDKKVVIVPNGVNPTFFRKFKNKNKIKNDKKVIGYVGALFEWVDIDLIYKSAKKLKNINFVLVGPISQDNYNIIKFKPNNVFFIGEKPYEDMPSFINSFDVAIIPFKVGSISESTDPIKVYEYFSLGKPVVSTFLRQLEKYNDGKLLKIAYTDVEFVEHLNFFLKNDNEKWKKERNLVVNQNTWYNRAKLMLNKIKEYV